MEYINIISKEPIMGIPLWQGFIVLVICIFLLICSFYLYRLISIDMHIYALCAIFIILGIEVASLGICDKYFSVPTGTYKYEATINKDKITIQQYEDFIEKYNPTIKDGVYYWESEEINYDNDWTICRI